MPIPSMRSGPVPAAAVAAWLLFGVSVAPAHAQDFAVTNLVSDGAVPAANIDPNLVNPWGIAYGPGGPFWVADNNSGLSTLYNSAGVPNKGLVVTVAPPAGQTFTAAPDGIVFNSSSGFDVSNGTTSAKPAFIFDTEDGTISGWAPSLSTSKTFLAVDNSQGGNGAVYKGLAMATVNGQSVLYASNFRSGEIEEYNSSFSLIKTFTDPNVAAGYAPFNVQVLNGQLYVTFALQDPSKHDDVAGEGNGYVDIFNLDGTFDKRLVSLGGQVDSPWGLDIAPADFGSFAGDLLVGNFGDGTISAFDIANGNFEGKLLGSNGMPIVEGDLWGLINGNGGSGGDPNDVYFTAGVANEADGVFGSISVPETPSWAMLTAGLLVMGTLLRQRAEN